MTVYTRVLQVGHDPFGYAKYLIRSTKEHIDYTNGRVMMFPEGPMVVVGHTNYSTVAGYEYIREIYVVSTTCYYPIDHPEDGDNAIIGYYVCKSGRGKVDVKRKPYVDGDSLLSRIEQNA